MTHPGANRVYIHRGQTGGNRHDPQQDRGPVRCREPRRAAGASSVSSMFCPIIAIELQRSDLPSGDDVLLQVREDMYDILGIAFDEAGVGWLDCVCECRGDVVIIAVPPHVSPEVLLDQLVTRLRAGLRRHNRLSSEIAQIRLRMAVHVGLCYFSPTGITGCTLTWLTELLAAPAFVRKFAEASTDLGLVASEYLYDELIRHGPGLIEPAAYELIKVPGDRTHACAWVHFPARPTRPVRPAPGHVPSDAQEVALQGSPGRRIRRQSSVPSQVTTTLCDSPPESVNVIVS